MHDRYGQLLTPAETGKPSYPGWPYIVHWITTNPFVYPNVSVFTPGETIPDAPQNMLFVDLDGYSSVQEQWYYDGNVTFKLNPNDG
jgi:hypothetical protein